MGISGVRPLQRLKGSNNCQYEHAERGEGDKSQRCHLRQCVKRPDPGRPLVGNDKAVSSSEGGRGSNR